MSQSLVRTAYAALTLTLVVALGGAPMAAAQSSQAAVEKPAPDFTLEDIDGEKHSLSEYEGKYVVLEWLNFQCPYVAQHYGSGHMQKLQEQYTDEGVVWLSIVSSAKGKQGYHPPEKMKEQKRKHDGKMSAILMDPSGEVGRAYGARTTPHMYVINPEGELLYKGGIDDWATADTGSPVPSETYIKEEAMNYVENALNQAMGREEVSPKTAKPYGCSVKYASM